MESIYLLRTKKEILYFSSFIILVFIISLSFEYYNFKKIKSEEIYSDTFLVLNIYKKENYQVLKLDNQNYTLYTAIDKNKVIKRLENINLTFITLNVKFIDYIKGFYAKSLYVNHITYPMGIKVDIYKNIENTHFDKNLKEFFSALFIAIPISNKLREICANYGISHLIAISGFHLGVITLIVFSFIYYPYSYLQNRYFPYRNKKFDIAVITIGLLFVYLVLLDFTPSFFRAFVMFVVGIYFLRSNIKLLSYENLILTFLLIIGFFPKFLFSLSFWFSIIAVFYIFLYIQYFKNIPKFISIIFFNIWIFLAFNPIVHYFFYNTSYEQLLSPILTLIFIVFYPLELFLHLISYGSLLDRFIMEFLYKPILSYEVITPFWFLFIYLLISLFSIFDKRVFWVLNILLVLFNLYLYL